MNKQDTLRNDITARLVEAIENGVKPWRMPWLQMGAPRNAASGKAYRGVNVWWLSLHMHDNKFTLPIYATFNQWKALGCSVKPRPTICPHGMYGSPIVFYTMVSKQDKNAPDDAVPAKFPILRSWTVFNIDQVTGGEKLAALRNKYTSGVLNSQVGVHADAEKIIKESEIKISYGGDRAFYRPADDSITLPERGRFTSLLSFYGTAFHELAHATGHSSRLNRCPKFDRFGSEAYAMEELVAEMAGVFLLSAVGLPVTTELENHASYLKNWLSVLKNDNRAIFTASSAAQSAADYMLKKAGLMEEGQEQPNE